MFSKLQEYAKKNVLPLRFVKSISAEWKVGIYLKNNNLVIIVRVLSTSDMFRLLKWPQHPGFRVWWGRRAVSLLHQSESRRCQQRLPGRVRRTLREVTSWVSQFLAGDTLDEGDGHRKVLPRFGKGQDSNFPTTSPWIRNILTILS